MSAFLTNIIKKFVIFLCFFVTSPQLIVFGMEQQIDDDYEIILMPEKCRINTSQDILNIFNIDTFTKKNIGEMYKGNFYNKSSAMLTPRYIEDEKTRQDLILFFNKTDFFHEIKPKKSLKNINIIAVKMFSVYHISRKLVEFSIKTRQEIYKEHKWHIPIYIFIPPWNFKLGNYEGLSIKGKGLNFLSPNTHNDDKKNKQEIEKVFEHWDKIFPRDLWNGMKKKTNYAHINGAMMIYYIYTNALGYYDNINIDEIKPITNEEELTKLFLKHNIIIYSEAAYERFIQEAKNTLFISMSPYHDILDQLTNMTQNENDYCATSFDHKNIINEKYNFAPLLSLYYSFIRNFKN